MARPLLIEFADGLYHLTSRGDRREDIYRKLLGDRDLSEIPRAQHHSLAKPLSEYATQHPLRDDAIAAAYAGGGHTMKAIGSFFGLHNSQVSRIVRRTAPIFSDF